MTVEIMSKSLGSTLRRFHNHLRARYAVVLAQPWQIGVDGLVGELSSIFGFQVFVDLIQHLDKSTCAHGARDVANTMVGT